MPARRDDDRRTSPAPSPGDVDDLARAIAAELTQLVREYREAHDVSYGQTVLGLGGGSTQVDQSDPTGDLAAAKDKRRLRGACRGAVEKLRDAEARVRECRADLRRGMNRLDGIDPWADAQRVARGERDQKFRRTASSDELLEARAAAERRRERGE